MDAPQLPAGAGITARAGHGAVQRAHPGDIRPSPAEAGCLTVVPGSIAHHGRAAHYRSEAARIQVLAEAAGDDGREGFDQAAQDYRDLADSLEDDDAMEDPTAVDHPYSPAP